MSPRLGSFRPGDRLHSRLEFNRILRYGQRVYSDTVVAAASPSMAGRPRLGLVIAKKVIRRAVDRNLVRRQLRESFRAHKHHLPPLDVVVRVATLPPTRGQLRAAADRLWAKL